MTIILYNSGFSANDILLTFLKYIENNTENEINKSLELYKIISVYYMKVNNSIDSILQLYACISKIYLLYIC